MGKKRIILLLLVFTTGSIFGQSDLCFNNASGKFWPIKAGTKLKYSIPEDSYTSYFNGDSLKVGNKYFLKEIEEYRSGKTRTNYWREEKGVVYFYDMEKNAESVCKLP